MDSGHQATCAPEKQTKNSVTVSGRTVDYWIHFIFCICFILSPQGSWFLPVWNECRTCPWRTPRSTGNRSTEHRSHQPGVRKWPAYWFLLGRNKRHSILKQRITLWGNFDYILFFHVFLKITLCILLNICQVLDAQKKDFSNHVHLKAGYCYLQQ